MKQFFENEGADYQAYIVENPIFSLLRHVDGVTVCTEDDYEPTSIPFSVSRSQMDLALKEMSLKGKGYVFDADEVCRDESSLPNFSPSELDNLFRLAATK